MIQRNDRDLAARLVEQLRDGTLSNLDFEAQWPDSRGDRALTAISSMLWRYYDDMYEHKLTEADALPDAAREIFDRCALFLLSNLEYVWPRDDFFSGGVDTRSGLLGLSDASWEFPDCDPEGTGPSGDVAAWPFLTVAEYQQTRCTHIEGRENEPV